MAAITVILPVYNGAKYLDQTLASLSAQIFDDFEVLCVDDCSTDQSAKIIQGYADHDARFVYLHTGSNLGMAAKAVNFAASKATGSWFVYSSQDDLFSKDWLYSLHDQAISTGADAILPDVEFYYENGSVPRRISGYLGDRAVRLTGKEAFVASLDWTIPGNALWPITFLKEKGFFDFGAFADEYTVRTYFLACKDVVFCKGVFFYRQDNKEAITKSPSPARLDEGYNNLMIWRLIVDNGFSPDVHGAFALRTLRSIIRAQALIFRTPALASEEHRIRRVWDETQSDPFRASLETGTLQKHKPLLRAFYLQAHRSPIWLSMAARLSAAVARIKT